MKILNRAEQIKEIRRERTALLAKVAKLEADLAYLAMMVGVDLGKGGSTSEKETEEEKPNV